MELPDAGKEEETSVVLGGEVARIKTYGELVTSIINPSHLPVSLRTEICGSCHNRGKSTKMEDVEWPVGFVPGRALGLYYKSTSYAAGDIKDFYANEFSRGHHQQYLDWEQSKHADVGVTCTSCHYSHELGISPARSQTYAKGSKVCMDCHVEMNQVGAHAIHSFGNCVGCHMPRIAKNAESGDLHSHVFKTLLPMETLRNPEIPNSCQTCHKHKDADLKKLVEEAYPKFGTTAEKELEIIEEEEDEDDEEEESS